MKIRKINLFGSWLTVTLLIGVALAQERGFTVQIASPTSEAEAQTMINELHARGVEAYLVKATVPGKGTRYRVRLGRFNSLAEAKTAGDRLRSRGAISEYVVMTYEPPALAAPVKKTPAVAQATTPPTEPSKPKPEPDKAPESSNNQAERAREPVKSAGKDATTAIPVNKNTSSATVTNQNPTPPEPSAPIAPPVLAIKSTPPQPAPATAPSSVDKRAALPDHDNDHAANNAEPPKAEPKIAAPPVADALADFSFSNPNWKVVRRSTETDKNLRTIYFVDVMTGWAAGDAGAVYRTTDGGRTWKPLLSGAAANINLIQFVDWNNGWMLGEADSKDTSEENASGTLLFSTNNGGRIWTRKSLPNVLSIYFIDAKNGWAVGKQATLLRTTDGGAEWQPVSGLEKLVGLPVESSSYSFGFRDLFFLNDRQGWLIGNFYGRARSHIGGLFTTEDGGQTWRRIPFTLQTQYTSGRFTPGLLHSVRFSDANTGSVTGEMIDGEGRFFFVLHTRDGGKTWEQFRTPSRATHSTQFLNLSNGWMAAAAPREGGAEAIVYDTTLLRTDNGGMSWQSDFVARGRRIRGLFFLSPGKGWAVGDRGMILRYEDRKSNGAEQTP